MSKVVSLFPWPQLSEDNFGAFWQIYPRKVNKYSAQRAWARLAPRDRIEALRVLPAHVDQWVRYETTPRHIPHAATWLHQRRFEDELEQPADLGQCEWNRNGNREADAPRCSERAEHSNAAGHVYCAAHASTLGLVRRKA